MNPEIPLPAPAVDLAAPDYKVTIELLGHPFKLPASGDDWPFEAVEAIEAGKFSTFVRALLDDAQYAQLRKLKPTSGQVGEFVKAYMEKLGN